MVVKICFLDKINYSMIVATLLNKSAREDTVK